MFQLIRHPFKRPTPGGGRLHPVLMRHPPQLSVKTGGGGGQLGGGVQPGVGGGGQAGGRGGGPRRQPHPQTSPSFAPSSSSISSRCTAAPPPPPTFEWCTTHALPLPYRVHKRVAIPHYRPGHHLEGCHCPSVERWNTVSPSSTTITQPCRAGIQRPAIVIRPVNTRHPSLKHCHSCSSTLHRYHHPTARATSISQDCQSATANLLVAKGCWAFGEWHVCLTDLTTFELRSCARVGVETPTHKDLCGDGELSILK